MAEIGITQLANSCFVPGITFHGIRTPSWASSSRNSAIVGPGESFDRSLDLFLLNGGSSGQNLRLQLPLHATRSKFTSAGSN